MSMLLSALPLCPSITARWRGVFPESKRGMLGELSALEMSSQWSKIHCTWSDHTDCVMHLNKLPKNQVTAGGLPCTSFWEMLWVLMREESLRTSPLNTHSWTGNSKSLVRMIGFLLLSLTIVSIDDELPLMLFALSCCCCCSTEDFWKALLDRKLLLVLLGIVPLEVSSYVSIISSFLFGLLWSFRMVRIFSPVIVATATLPG